MIWGVSPGIWAEHFPSSTDLFCNHLRLCFNLMLLCPLKADTLFKTTHANLEIVDERPKLNSRRAVAVEGGAAEQAFHVAVACAGERRRRPQGFQRSHRQLWAVAAHASATGVL